MPAKAPCLTSGCPNDAILGQSYCTTHYVPFKGSTRRERLPKDWSDRRRIVLKHYNYICYVCNEPGADAVDHIIPGDDHSFENLKPIHHNTPNSWGEYCHRLKTAQEGVAAWRPKKWN